MLADFFLIKIVRDVFLNILNKLKKKKWDLILLKNKVLLHLLCKIENF